MKKSAPVKSKYQRPSWDEYFSEMASYVGSRATCDRGRSGCVIVRDKRVISTGYVGSPPGLPHCDEVGHDIHMVLNEDGTKSEHCVRTTHAEQNAMIQAARFGVALEGATIYCKMVMAFIYGQQLAVKSMFLVVSFVQMEHYLTSKVTIWREETI